MKACRTVGYHPGRVTGLVRARWGFGAFRAPRGRGARPDEDGHEGDLAQHGQHNRVAQHEQLVRQAQRAAGACAAQHGVSNPTSKESLNPSVCPINTEVLTSAQLGFQGSPALNTVSTTESPSTNSSFVRPSARLVPARHGARCSQ